MRQLFKRVEPEQINKSLKTTIFAAPAQYQGRPVFQGL